MSVSKNILNILDENTKFFINHFDFYLDIVDEAISLQGKIGLNAESMQLLPEHDQNLIKTYVFLVESGNTTWAASLRLLASGFNADIYGLLRILYETAALLHYGNSAPPDTRTELYRTMFKSGLPENEHQKNEWKLVQKATQYLEKHNPGFKPVRKKLNNFGAHISRSKIVIGNITAIGDSSASRIFSPNWSCPHFLMGLEFLLSIKIQILEEYAHLQKTYNGLPTDAEQMIKRIAGKVISLIRPKLQAMMKKNK